MELQAKTVDNLRSLVQYYESYNLEPNDKFLMEIVGILKEDERFHNILKFKLAKGCYEIDSTIYTNTDSIMRKNMIVINSFLNDFSQDEQFKLRLFLALFIMLHEASHVWQFSGLDDNMEINRLYETIGKTGNHLIPKIFYNIFSYDYCFERHANIDATRTLVKIYEESAVSKVAQAYYLFYLDSLYKFFSPLRKTLFFMGIKNDFDFSDLSFIEKLTLGDDLKKAELEELDQIVIANIQNKLPFKEALSRIYKL